MFSLRRAVLPRPQESPWVIMKTQRDDSFFMSGSGLTVSAFTELLWAFLPHKTRIQVFFAETLCQIFGATQGAISYMLERGLSFTDTSTSSTDFMTLWRRNDLSCCNSKF
jgi:hypothetical protein